MQCYLIDRTHLDNKLFSLNQTHLDSVHLVVMTCNLNQLFFKRTIYIFKWSDLVSKLAVIRTLYSKCINFIFYVCFLQQQEAGPLKGVVIAVSKKLSSHQAEYNNMVSLLGGDYRWTYDESCTHFIFQVR